MVRKWGMRWGLGRGREGGVYVEGEGSVFFAGGRGGEDRGDMGSLGRVGIVFS